MTKDFIFIGLSEVFFMLESFCDCHSFAAKGHLWDRLVLAVFCIAKISLKGLIDPFNFIIFIFFFLFDFILFFILLELGHRFIQKAETLLFSRFEVLLEGFLIGNEIVF